MTDSPKPKLVSYWWAIEQVGNAVFGAELSLHSTVREDWVLAVLLAAVENPASQVRTRKRSPSMDLWVKRIPHWMDREEALAALRQRAYRSWQFDQIWDWFEDWGVPLIADSEIGDWYEQEPFETAFTMAFPHVALGPRPDPDLEKKMAISGARWGYAYGRRTPLNSKKPNPRASPMGRPPKWDWDGMHREVIHLIATSGSVPKTQAKLEEKVANWFVQNTGDQPAESQIREKVGAIYQAIAKAKKSRK